MSLRTFLWEEIAHDLVKYFRPFIRDHTCHIPFGGIFIERGVLLR